MSDYQPTEPHPIADAIDPTPLRWGLNDVEWGDDDSVTVLLSGPNGEPYSLELDQERAAVLREDLAGPDDDLPDSLAAATTAERAAESGMTPTAYRAHSHETAAQEIRDAARRLYADAGLRVLAALDETAAEAQAE
ncbi:hypothetical protein [Streptomyces sp. SP17KL33]|uniref:hypothetical protein n=1 Tax=Streptomyces sp. SP17KL33 TaxID=3002534 RepID=UPI002E787DE7|nr:hypothetical protein [Streptomyces sp. SP17KL33]MEE1838155.1 hypothetical protein [Streptomyces sp. SP17KL33]